MTRMELEIWIAELIVARQEIFFEADMVFTQEYYDFTRWSGELSWDGRHLRSFEWAPEVKTWAHEGDISFVKEKA